MSATITAFPVARRSDVAGRAGHRSAEVGAAVRDVQARTGAGTRPARMRLHLTRRGRVVLTLLVVVPLLAVLGAVMLNGGGAAATGSAGDVHFQHVTIASGETLWQVAEQVAPKSDPRDVIDAIVRLNDLSSTDVMAGQSIAIPTQYSAAH